MQQVKGRERPSVPMNAAASNGHRLASFAMGGIPRRLMKNPALRQRQLCALREKNVPM
jgi:hypothetical protein